MNKQCFCWFLTSSKHWNHVSSVLCSFKAFIGKILGFFMPFFQRTKWSMNSAILHLSTWSLNSRLPLNYWRISRNREWDFSYHDLPRIVTLIRGWISSVKGSCLICPSQERHWSHLRKGGGLRQLNMTKKEWNLNLSH